MRNLARGIRELPVGLLCDSAIRSCRDADAAPMLVNAGCWPAELRKENEPDGITARHAGFSTGRQLQTMSRTRHHGDKAKQRQFGDNWQWLRSTPSEWVRIMMTKPQRAETRRLLHAVQKMDDLDDAPQFPLAKKPHVYYW